MYISVIIILIIYLILILYVFCRYNLDASPTERYDTYSEELEIEPSEAGYLVDKNINSMNLILADILTLTQKGYIEMELIKKANCNEYCFKKVKNKDLYSLKNHEAMSYNLFFANGIGEVNLEDFIKQMLKDNELVHNIEIKLYAIKESIKTEFENQGILETKSREKLFKYNKMSIMLVFIAIPMIIISLILKSKEFILISNTIFLFSLILKISTNYKEDKRTIKGANLLEKSLAFRRYLKENTIINDKPLYMTNILEYNYIMAVAFGLATLGEKEFIKDEYNLSILKSKMRKREKTNTFSGAFLGEIAKLIIALAITLIMQWII